MKNILFFHIFAFFDIDYIEHIDLLPGNWILACLLIIATSTDIPFLSDKQLPTKN